MTDQYGRSIDYLRISLTDRCSLRCVYCMPEDGIAQLPHSDILEYDELVRIARVMAESLGLKKIKLTGGEPLARKGCAQLVKQLKELPGIEKVTLTTNGVELARHLPELSAAGLDAVNVSLDTLDREEFIRLTRRDRLADVLAGLAALRAYPNIVRKLNVVPISSSSETLLALAGLAQNDKLCVRFIEMMPIGRGREYPFRSEETLVDLFQKRYGTMTPTSEHYGNGPGHYYTVDGFEGKIGFISAITHKFCDHCNRVRLTAEGYLKTCLQYDYGCDLRELLRGGCTDAQLTERIRQTIWEKPLCHHFNEQTTGPLEYRGMSQIGG